MLCVVFVLHDRLQDFLPPSQRGHPIPCAFRGPQSLKHLLESLDVPHPEVGEVRCDGRQVGLDYLPADGEVFEVFPWPDGGLPLPTPPRFVLDGHLGRLAAYLRLLGLDTWYTPQADDATLARIAAQEERVLLTRDRDLLKRRQVRYGYWVRALQPRRQLAEVVQRFALRRYARPFHRCLACNGWLDPVPKAAVLDRLEPLTRRYYHEFRRCRQCGRVFWKGSHYRRLVRLLVEVLGWEEEALP